MRFPALAVCATLLLAACSAPQGPGVAPPEASAERSSSRSLLAAPTTCASVRGTGDSHIGNGQFYRLSVNATSTDKGTRGTVSLYVMNDILFQAPNPLPEPLHLKGTVSRITIAGDTATVTGTWSDGTPFTLTIADHATKTTGEDVHDVMWLDSQALSFADAWIHEGDFEVTGSTCP